MATYSIPGQNLTLNLPDVGQIFRAQDNPNDLYRRVGNTYQSLGGPVQTAATDLIWNGTIYKAGSVLPTITANDQANIHSVNPYTGNLWNNTYQSALYNQQNGADAFNALPTFNLADVQTGLSRIAGSDLIDQAPVNNVVPQGNVTQGVSATNPNAYTAIDASGNNVAPTEPAFGQPGALTPSATNIVNPNPFNNGGNVTPSGTNTYVPPNIYSQATGTQPLPTTFGSSTIGSTGNGNQTSGTQGSSTISLPSTSLQPGATGDAVKQLQDYLVANGYMTQAQVNTGYGTYGPQTTAAVQALQQKLGVDNSSGPGYFGPKTMAAIQASGSGSSNLGSSMNTNTPISINTGSQGTFDSSLLGSNLSTTDVLNKAQGYQATIDNYLKQQADAQAALNNTKAYQLQQEASIRNSDSVAPLQGQDLAELEKQMAFRTVPAEIALQNAQTALALYKQSPEYLAQQQSLSTAQNLIQSYPDLGITYNPQLSPEQNLQLIQSAVSNSPRFQAMNSVLGTNPITGQPMIINKLGSKVTSTPIGGGTSVSQVSQSTAYTPGSTITNLPQGVPSLGQSAMDQTAISLFNGKIAPSEVKGRGLQTDAILAQATKISLALTGKPFDAAAAQTAFDFRQTPKYQNYVNAAPTAIRNLQDMVNDVQTLGITGNLSVANWTKINLISNGLWFDSTQEKITAAKDLLSKYAQSADDIGLLLGTGSGSDAKLAIGSAIFQPNGSLVSSQQLADNVTKTILNKLTDTYRQAGVSDPTPYLSQDMAKIYQTFQSTGGAGGTGLNSTSQSILQKYGIQ